VSIVSPNGVCPGKAINFTTNVNSVAPISTYAWNFGNLSGGGNTSSLATPTYTYNNSGSYTVTVTVTASSGCTASATKQITVYQNPVANAGPDKAICFGGSTTITGSGGTAYQWMPATALSATSGATVTANPTATTTYNLVVTNANGCTASDVMILTVNPLPTVYAGTDKTICPGVPTQLMASGASTYQWSPATALNNANIANPMASPSVQTTYVVTGTSAQGCTGKDTIVINVYPAAQAQTGNDVTICSGEQAQLTATGGNTYSWSPSNNLSSANSPNPIASPTVTTVYTVVVTDNNGCQASSQMVVYVNPLPPVDAGPNQSICNGLTANLQASGALTYLWHSDNTLNNPNISNPVVQPTITNTYYVTGSDANGCSSSDSVVITVIQPFTMEVGQGAEVCRGSQVQLSASGAVTYKWIPSNTVDNAFVPNPLASPSVTTTYTVIGTDGVCFQDVQQVVVIVHDVPTAEAGENVIIVSGETVTLDGQGNGTSFSWQPPAGLSCTDCPTPQATPQQTTTYTLTVTNEFGCQRRDSVVIRVGCNDDVVFIPNAFSPNEDGQNDVFYIRSKGLRNVEYLRIYDRWGKVMFESNSLSNGWDGTNNGKTVNPGVYVYQLKAVCSNGQPILMQGNITLVK
jgi:gliding motility-associated-like protein